MTAKRWIQLAFACVATWCVAGCDCNFNNVPPDKAVDALLFEGRYRWCRQPSLLGMEREKAMALLPKPHNTNTENVVVWFDHYSNVMKQGDRDWRTMWGDGGGGVFIVFVNNHVASGIKIMDAGFTPWNVLETEMHMERGDIERILDAPWPKGPPWANAPEPK